MIKRIELGERQSNGLYGTPTNIGQINHKAPLNELYSNGKYWEVIFPAMLNSIAIWYKDSKIYFDLYDKYGHMRVVNYETGKSDMYAFTYDGFIYNDNIGYWVDTEEEKKNILRNIRINRVQNKIMNNSLFGCRNIDERKVLERAFKLKKNTKKIMATVIVLQKSQILDEDMEGNCTYENVIDCVYLVSLDNLNIDIEFVKYQADFFTERGVKMIIEPLGVRIAPNPTVENKVGKMMKIRNDFKKELSLKYFIEKILNADKMNFTTPFYPI